MKVVIPAESLLIRPQRIVDPFNRISQSIQPTLLAIEFCQIEGPKPLSVHTYGSEESSLDLDALCVWLMSSETATGTVLSLYNQQMAIYALSYHCVFYDIRARAFQRPVCFAFLTSQRPGASQLVKFTENIRKVVSPTLLCNRRLFFKSLVDMRAFLDNNDEDSDQMQILKQSHTSTHKFHSVVEQIEKVWPRVQQLFSGLSYTGDSECRGHPSTSKTEHIEVLNLVKNTGILRPLQEIAPCTFVYIAPALEVLLTQLARPSTRRGALYSTSVPVLRLLKIETPVKEKNSQKDGRKVAEKEQSLRTITPNLDNILYTVLAGDDLVVCGTSQRKQTVIDLVEKLNSLLPRSHTNYTVTSWGDDALTLPHGIVGLAATKTTSVSLPAVNRSILDLNTNLLRTIPYSGQLLAEFRQKKKFPNDEILITYISAIISKICSYVYLARHLPLSALKNEGLSTDDERLIANLLTELDIVKYQAQRYSFQAKRVHSVVRCINL